MTKSTVTLEDQWVLKDDLFYLFTMDKFTLTPFSFFYVNNKFGEIQ